MFSTWDCLSGWIMKTYLNFFCAALHLLLSYQWSISCIQQLLTSSCFGNKNPPVLRTSDDFEVNFLAWNWSVPAFSPFKYKSFCGHVNISSQDFSSIFGNYVIDDFSNVGSAHNLTNKFTCCRDPQSMLTYFWNIIICNSDRIKPTGLDKYPKDSNLILMTKNNRFLAHRRFYISTKQCLCISSFHITGAHSRLSWELPEAQHLV